MPVTIDRVETVYQGWLRVLMAHLRGDDGQTFQRAIEDHGDNGRGCAVLPYDPERRTALLVRLPRAPVLHLNETRDLIEAPAGLIDEGESGEQAAVREAFEETGVRLTTLEPLGLIWSMPGISSERMALFLAPYAATDRVAEGGGLAEEHENITVLELPLAELARLADAHLLLDMRTFAMVQTLRLRRPDLFD